MSAGWFVYIVRCGDGSLYTGITTDVGRRFREHGGGDRRGARYLRGKGPLELVFKERVGEKSAALKVEAKIKKMPRSRKEKLVSGETVLGAIPVNFEP